MSLTPILCVLGYTEDVRRDDQLIIERLDLSVMYYYRDDVSQ